MRARWQRQVGTQAPRFKINQCRAKHRVCSWCMSPAITTAKQRVKRTSVASTKKWNTREDEYNPQTQLLYSRESTLFSGAAALGDLAQDNHGYCYCRIKRKHNNTQLVERTIPTRYHLLQANKGARHVISCFCEPALERRISIRVQEPRERIQCLKHGQDAIEHCFNRQSRCIEQTQNQTAQAAEDKHNIKRDISR